MISESSPRSNQTTMIRRRSRRSCSNVISTKKGLFC